MVVNLPGIITIGVFYIVITAIGVFFGKRKNKTNAPEELFLANRNLGLFVTSLTIAASMIGGGFFLGTAEIVGKAGLVWCIAPSATFLALPFIAIFIAPKIYSQGYTTILDPIQAKYGVRMGALLSIPELLGDLFWEASVFTALGSTLSAALEINIVTSIIVSACVTTGYTIFGGLFSVAYTDVIQFFFMASGLVLALSFSIQHPAVDFSTIKYSWAGQIPTSHIGRFVDTFLMFSLGAATFQALYQRVMASKTQKMSQRGLVIALLIVYCMLVPSVMVGLTGKATDWNMTDYQGEVPLSRDQWTFLFPMVLKYLCPSVVSIIGIGTVSAAVMSSADSAMLAAGSIITHNVYGKLIRPNTTAGEMVWALRLSILVVGILGTAMAITVRSVFGLLLIVTDIAYVVQFPQLWCVLRVPFSNIYGSILGIICGLILRILGGEPLVGLPVVIKYPFFSEQFGQLFPFKTMAMLLSFLTIVSVSYLTHVVFTYKILDKKFDIFKCFEKKNVAIEMEALPTEPLEGIT